MGISGHVAGLALGVLLIALAGPSAAEWRVYTSADLGFSVGTLEPSGEFELADATMDDFGGDDLDVSPLVAVAVGLAVPMDELTVWQLPRGWRLPDWDLRLEAEWSGLRNYKLSTDAVAASANALQTEVDESSWLLMTNWSLDVPLRGLYKPISWTSARLFGKWRLRTLKQILDRTTFEPTVGIGVSYMDAKTQEATTRGTGRGYNFAWQAGAGFGYQLTDAVNLGVGYRYIDPGELDYEVDGGGVVDSTFELHPRIHEARMSLRVEVWDFAQPWR